MAKRSNRFFYWTKNPWLYHMLFSLRIEINHTSLSNKKKLEFFFKSLLLHELNSHNIHPLHVDNNTDKVVFPVDIILWHFHREQMWYWQYREWIDRHSILVLLKIIDNQDKVFHNKSINSHDHFVHELSKHRIYIVP